MGLAHLLGGEGTLGVPRFIVRLVCAIDLRLHSDTVEGRLL